MQYLFPLTVSCNFTTTGKP